MIESSALKNKENIEVMHEEEEKEKEEYKGIQRKTSGLEPTLSGAVCITYILHHRELWGTLAFYPFNIEFNTGTLDSLVSFLLPPLEQEKYKNK